MPKVTVPSWDLFLPDAKRAEIIALDLSPEMKEKDIWLDTNPQLSAEQIALLHNAMAIRTGWLAIDDPQSREWDTVKRPLITFVPRNLAGYPLGVVHILKPEFAPEKQAAGDPEVRIEYFGLFKRYQCSGYGPLFLNAIVQALYCRFPSDKIVLDTSETDVNKKEKKALDFYLRFGFEIAIEEPYTKLDYHAWYQRNAVSIAKDFWHEHHAMRQKPPSL